MTNSVPKQLLCFHDGKTFALAYSYTHTVT